MIFVDSSAWIALEIPDDTNHGAAVAVWKRVQRGEFGTAVTSDGVLSESLTDCISFIHMEGSHAETAFSFDEDFRQAGFPVVPELK